MFQEHVWFKAVVGPQKNRAGDYPGPAIILRICERNYLPAFASLRTACAAAKRAIGTRKGLQLTYVRPRRWQNSTELGSPPCSPQMPSLMSGRVWRPFSTAIFINSPT